MGCVPHIQGHDLRLVHDLGATGIIVEDKSVIAVREGGCKLRYQVPRRPMLTLQNEDEEYLPYGTRMCELALYIHLVVQIPPHTPPHLGRKVLGGHGSTTIHTHIHNLGGGLIRESNGALRGTRVGHYPFSKYMGRLRVPPR